MKVCARCRHENPDAAGFCMGCGSPLTAPAPVPPMPTGMPQAVAPVGAPAVPIPNAKKQNLTWLWALLGLLAIGIGFAQGFGGLFSKLAGKPQSEMLVQKGPDGKPILLPAEGGASPSLLEAQGQSDPSLLQAQGNPNSDLTRVETPPPPEAKRMPPEVLDWLRHLERTENQRRRMALKQVGEAKAMMMNRQLDGAKELLNDPMGDGGMPESPVEKVAMDVDGFRKGWRDLIQSFASKAPPEECIPIRNRYDTALSETGAMMSDLLEIIAGIDWLDSEATQKDLLGKLYAMQGTSKVIDEAGNETDGLVQEICDKYEVRKWFKVSGDIGDSGLLGGMGL